MLIIFRIYFWNVNFGMSLFDIIEFFFFNLMEFVFNFFIYVKRIIKNVVFYNFIGSF